MEVEASMTGVVKMLLMIIGVFVLLRFLGRMMLAKNAVEEERRQLKKEKDFLRERNQKLKKFGKTEVLQDRPKGDVQDVDFEEIE